MSARPDYQRAQEMLRAALHEMVDACLDPHDVAAFLVVTQASVSAVVAEIVSADRIATPAGVDDIVRASSAQLAGFLREDLAKCLAHDRQQARH